MLAFRWTQGAKNECSTFVGAEAGPPSESRTTRSAGWL